MVEDSRLRGEGDVEVVSIIKSDLKTHAFVRSSSHSFFTTTIIHINIHTSGRAYRIRFRRTGVQHAVDISDIAGRAGALRRRPDVSLTPSHARALSLSRPLSLSLTPSCVLTCFASFFAGQVGMLRHLQRDVQVAIDVLTVNAERGTLTAATLTSHEMKTLYTLVAVLVALTVKPVRSAVYKTVDTLVALVLLIAISAVVLGIPFAITYLGFKAVTFVSCSLLAAFQAALTT